MNDTCSELLVARKPRASEQILRILMIALTVLLVLASFLIHPVCFILFVVMLVVDYFILPRFHVEYEYDYVNGSLDIDQIFSKASRKHLLSLDLTQSECVAPLGSHSLDSYGNSYQVVDYSSGYPDQKPYVVATTENGGHRKILVHLDEVMLHDLSMRCPRKVFTD